MVNPDPPELALQNGKVVLEYSHLGAVEPREGFPWEERIFKKQNKNKVKSKMILKIHMIKTSIYK